MFAHNVVVEPVLAIRDIDSIDGLVAELPIEVYCRVIPVDVKDQFVCAEIEHKLFDPFKQTSTCTTALVGRPHIKSVQLVPLRFIWRAADVREANCGVALKRKNVGALVLLNLSRDGRDTQQILEHRRDLLLRDNIAVCRLPSGTSHVVNQRNIVGGGQP